MEAGIPRGFVITTVEEFSDTELWRMAGAEGGSVDSGVPFEAGVPGGFVITTVEEISDTEF